MKFEHTSVLFEETIKYLNIKPNGIYVDGTLGGGGHSIEIVKRLNDEGMLIGIDRDQNALKAAGERLRDFKNRTILLHGNFRDIYGLVTDEGYKNVDGILLDLGVSSHQLDEAERGFSYMKDAPLDMRMDETQSLTAGKVVNTYSRQELSRIIKEYGEERWASRIASFIEKERVKKPIETTRQLVDVIKSAIPAAARRKGAHPAKRTFQAIRIEVNNELCVLKDTISDGINLLKSGGRICVISFHSLEDRRVKDKLKELENPCTCPKEFPVCVCGKQPVVKVITRKAVIPGEEEIEHNPRSRSARLRVAEKL